MDRGIRAEVRVVAAEACPVARASADTGVPSYDISRSVAPGSDVMTEEFVLAADGETPPEPADRDRDLRVVFAYGTERAYRFERERGSGCPCELIEAVGCPVVENHARDGALFATFHADDVETLRTVVDELHAAYDDVTIVRLLRSAPDAPGHDLVSIDRGMLTERQREVLRAAHERGYFDHPKGANATEVAEGLGISRATFTEHLSAAQRKLLDALLDGVPDP